MMAKKATRKIYDVRDATGRIVASTTSIHIARLERDLCAGTISITEVAR